MFKVLIDTCRQSRCSGNSAKRVCNRFDGRKGIINFVAEHTDQSLPGHALLRAQRFRCFRKHDEPVLNPVLAEVRPSDYPASLNAREGARNCLRRSKNVMPEDREDKTIYKVV